MVVPPAQAAGERWQEKSTRAPQMHFYDTVRPGDKPIQTPDTVVAPSGEARRQATKTPDPGTPMAGAPGETTTATTTACEPDSAASNHTGATMHTKFPLKRSRADLRRIARANQRHRVTPAGRPRSGAALPVRRRRPVGEVRDE